MSSNPAGGSSRRQFNALNDVKTSRSCGAVAGALTLGVSFCQEKNAHFTCKNAHHPLFIGVRCTLTVKKWVNSSIICWRKLRWLAASVQAAAGDVFADVRDSREDEDGKRRDRERRNG